MPNFSMTLSGGHFATEPELKRLAEGVLDPSLKRGAIVMRDAIRSVTPIVSGNLHNHTEVGAPFWDGRVRRIKIEANAPYADRVNKFSRKNRGYWQRGVAKGQSPAQASLQQGVKSLAANLWVKGK